MRLHLPSPHGLSIELANAWRAEDQPPDLVEDFGAYVRSEGTRITLNVRAQSAGDHPRTERGMTAFLREQNWASKPFNAWSETVATEDGPLFIAGGSFETVGMGGEVVLEIFATNGSSVANFAGSGERDVMVALTPIAQELARSLRFDPRP
jgi:hypothetical protein